MIHTSRSVVPISRSLTLAFLTGALLAASGFAAADADLDQKIRNPDDWAAQAGDYANHRWSDLKQIDATTLVALDAKTGITGISGGEFGVRGRLIAYDIRTGKRVWTAWSTGPDHDLLVDPAHTMTWTNGKMGPIGKDSSLKTWQGDEPRKASSSAQRRLGTDLGAIRI